MPYTPPPLGKIQRFWKCACLEGNEIGKEWNQVLGRINDGLPIFAEPALPAHCKMGAPDVEILILKGCKTIKSKGYPGISLAYSGGTLISSFIAIFPSFFLRVCTFVHR